MKKNHKIASIKAREILDSRGNPTVEVDLTTDLGIFRASVPSGVSKGKYEAAELRDGGKRYGGKGVLRAVRNVNKIIAPKLKGKDATGQREIDEFLIKLDGTKNKSKLGANAILPVSMAVCRAGAAVENLPLWKYVAQISKTRKPVLPNISLLLIEGGVHAGNELDFQEFMIVPQDYDPPSSLPLKRASKAFPKNLQIATEIYHELKNIIKEKYIDLSINVGDEGGFAPPVRAPEEAIELILQAAENLGYQNKIKIIIDVAASQFYSPPQKKLVGGKKGTYKTRIGDFTREGLFDYYSDLIQKYPILGLEDPFAEEDWEGFRMLSRRFGKRIHIIGDDLLTTNTDRIKKAIAKKACNGLLLKLNQIGTVSEAIEAAKCAIKNGWIVMVSQRGGETCDSFYADACVGLGTGWIKTGAPARGERVAKYNRLLQITEEL